MDEEKPKPIVNSTQKDGVADGKADLSPDEIKHFYQTLLGMMKQAPDIFFQNSHYWPTHENQANSSNKENDYQWARDRYLNGLNNVSSFCLNPNRAVYKENLEMLRDRIADKTDLMNMREMTRKYMTAKQAKKDGYLEPDPKLMRKALDWIDKVDKLTTDFCAKVDAMYPPEQQKGLA